MRKGVSIAKFTKISLRITAELTTLPLIVQGEALKNWPRTPVKTGEEFQGGELKNTALELILRDSFAEISHKVYIESKGIRGYRTLWVKKKSEFP
jgi:hypothetical protein